MSTNYHLSSMGVAQRRALLRANEGSECIYKEDRTVCHARVHSIDADDWGVKAELVPIPAPGLSAVTEAWSIATIWAGFQCDAAAWNCGSSAMCWRVLFDPALIRDVKELAKTLPSEESEWDRFGKLMKCINDSEVRRLYPYLRPRPD